MSATILIVLLLAVLVGVPLLTLVHELGHALVAAAVIGGPVAVLQGPEPRRLVFSVWRLELRLHGLGSPLRAWVGWARWPSHPSRVRHALALAGGPAASLVASAGLVFGAAQVHGSPRAALLLLAADAGLQALSSSVPVRYPAFSGAYAGAASDGLKIRRLLSGTTESPLTAAAGPRPDPAPHAPPVRDRAAEA